jgi:5-amino-6-(5-phosphoribosylamino)uracil reductase
LRLVLAISLDGRLAPPEGGPAQLGGKGDRRLLEEALAWADSVLVGARTLRLHRSSCLIHAPDLLRSRQERGLPPQPPVVVWSRGGDIACDLPFFQQPFERWLLTPAAGHGPFAAAPGFHTILPFDDWPTTLHRLGALGLRRIAVLGGAQLAGALVEARVLDELQLTLCPMLLGGEHLWMPSHVWSDPTWRWRLVRGEVLEGGELLQVYRREGEA